MTCTEVQEREIAEAYLLGRLDAAERDAFEQHYFECARCYSELQALRSVRDALAAARPAARRIDWQWLGVAAAILVAVGAGTLWLLRAPTGTPPPASGTTAAQQSPAPEAVLAQLAAVAPPPYEPRQLRSAGERAAFTEGMRQYQAHDYAGAVPLLGRAVSAEPDAEDARFYLGASLLLEGKTADAVAMLAPLSVKPASPYAEESQFLIAKAHLRAGNLDAAAAALEKTAAMHGDRENEARNLRARVRELQSRRGTTER